MKQIILSTLFLLSLLASSSFSSNKKVKTQFPEEMNIYSFSGAETLVVGFLDFDLKKVKDSAFSESACRERAIKEYERIKVSSKAQNVLFDEYYEGSNDKKKPSRTDSITALGIEEALEQFLIPDEMEHGFDREICAIFTDKPYFDRTKKIKESFYDSLRVERYKEIEKAVVSLLGPDSSFDIHSIKSDDSQYRRVPIALFLGKNGKEYCWIVIEGWDDGSSGLFDAYYGETDPEVYMNSMSGVIYSFDFSETLVSFGCD